MPKPLPLCVQTEDIKSQPKLPGVGKTAERLIIEMRDRLLNGKRLRLCGRRWKQRKAQENARLAEAESALVALGYKPQDAAKMLSKVASQASSAEELIRLALKHSLG